LENAMTNPNQQIAQTILEQMGGKGKIVAMTGARDFLILDRGIQFSFPKAIAGINRVKIILTDADLYDIEFGSVRRKDGIPTYTRRNLCEGVYADRLKKIFEKETGLFLSL
jgi:hypothetical protein